jgi:hypothetical protein
MLSELEKAGLPKRTIYTLQRKHPTYYFKFHGHDCIKMYNYFYNDVPPTQYLERKHSLFKKYADQQRVALKDAKDRQISIFKTTA